MFGFGCLLSSSSNINPNSISGIKLWIDSESNVGGANDSALDSLGDKSIALNNLSNTSGTGTRPVWSLTTSGGTSSFKSGTKHGIDLESGGDWLSTSGLDTAINFTCNTALTVFHVTRSSATNSTASTSPNTPLNILGKLGSTGTAYTSVGFSSGTARYITWEGAAFVTYNSIRTNINDGTPHTVCWTHSGTTLICYIDGILDSTQTTGTYQSTNGFNGIGGRGNTDGFIGGIAEIIIWNNVISLNQVKQLHSRAKSLWF